MVNNLELKKDGKEVSSADKFGASSAGVLKILLLLLLVFSFYGIMHFTALGERLHGLMAWRQMMAEGGVKNLAVFIGLTAVLITFGSPRLIFFTLGGFFFGFIGGLIGALIASLAASLINFNLVRWAGRDLLKARLGNKPMVDWVMCLRPTVWSVFLIRQLPISNVVVNVSLAMSSTGNRDFIFGSLFGFLPLGAAAALIGSGLADEGLWMGIVQLAAATVVLLIFCCWFWRRGRNIRLQRIRPIAERPRTNEGDTFSDGV